MQHKYVSFESVTRIAAPDDNVVMSTLLGQLTNTPEVSVTWVTLDGRHRDLRSGPGVRVYFVIDGEFDFVIGEDRVRVHLSSKDTLELAPRELYGFSGYGTYLVINSPAYAHGDDQFVE